MYKQMISMARHYHTRLFCVLLISLLCLLTLGKMVKEWQHDFKIAHPQKAIALVTKNKVNPDQEAIINEILTTHLFGRSVPMVGNMPLTNLQLHLTGIVQSANESKAYIAIANQPGKIYHTGEQLAYGAKIYAITNDTVVLQNDDRLEKLTLAREKLEFKLPQKKLEHS